MNIPHSDRAHAKLGPSSSARWLTCPGSEVIIPIVEEKYPPKRDGSRNSNVGTIAHEASEAMLLNQVPNRAKIVEANSHENDEPLSDDEWDEILEHSLGFREYVRELMDAGDLLLIEERVHIPQVNEDTFGTADVIIYKHAEKKLIVVDLKYGMSRVIIENNSQIMLYLLGAANMLIAKGHSVKSYEGHIYQPRVVNGIGGCEYSDADMDEFELRVAIAVDAIKLGSDVRVPSEKGCQWCPANGTEYCQESIDWAARDVLKLLDEMDKSEDINVTDRIKEIKELDPSKYSIEDLAKIYLLFPAAKKWMEKVEAHLMPLAAEGDLETLKVVEGRGSNTCIDPEEVAFIVGDKAWKDRTLKSKTDLTKIVGAKNFDDLLGDCFKKLPGKPNLVSVDDRRPAMPNNETLLAELDD